MSQESSHGPLGSKNPEKEKPSFGFQISFQPSIQKDGWGEIYVLSEGEVRKFRDVVLLPERALAWDWKWSDDEGMDHSPGIREKDLAHYILSTSPLPHTVILSTGRSEALHVDPARKEYLLNHGIQEVYILDTVQAIRKYQELCASGISVAALIHTTC